jgi:ABC-type bacteriocin/lantibiotic exporter with double-glycine peptidase domain
LILSLTKISLAVAAVPEEFPTVATTTLALGIQDMRQHPAIAHWEGKHYIVVYEITPKKVIVCDPAIGQLSLTHAQFQAGWTGYALLLQPTALLKEALPRISFKALVTPSALMELDSKLTPRNFSICHALRLIKHQHLSVLSV